MNLNPINPANTVFIALTFEGPDLYSMAGGLGVRITHITETLSNMGYEVHHFFIGDPNEPGLEFRMGGNLIFHRWCQWISHYHPNGVYDGEEGKLNDFNDSIPSYIVDHIAAPAIMQGKLVVILGEEWHTAEVMCRLSDLLYCNGLRDNTIMFWNANNTYGFDRINWGRLAFTTTITTVSKYMRTVMQGMGINALVIPNGIPEELLYDVDYGQITEFRDLFDADLVLSKVARWHQDKNWEATVEAVAKLKGDGRRPMLLARGGVEPYGGYILDKARHMGLDVTNVYLEEDVSECFRMACEQGDYSPYMRAFSESGPADVFNLNFPVPQAFLRIIYGSSDVVLANSAHEPFGIVGLEAMAVGSVVFTGCTGEDYALHMLNSVVLDTYDADEIRFYINNLQDHPAQAQILRFAAKQMAGQFVWEEVLKKLMNKIEQQALKQGVYIHSIPQLELSRESELVAVC
ncbi:MAG: glycosyltransferase family 4 protein [Chloroflexota bacterium]|nr:glycosyltransferase family 4 protein [Chloroflexota bacterium]